MGNSEALLLLQVASFGYPGCSAAGAVVRNISCTRPRVEGVHLRGGTRRPRRAALVRSAGGFPYRGAGPGQGAAGQERGDCAGGRQGRFRGQAVAGGHVPGGSTAAKGIACYQAVHSRGLLDLTDNQHVDAGIERPDTRGGQG